MILFTVILSFLTSVQISSANTHSSTDSNQNAPIDSICYNFQVNPTPKTSYVVPKCRVIGDTMYWEGVVTNDFIFELALYPSVRHLELNSVGGELQAGLEVARAVRKGGLTTNVRKNAFCASACTLIYQAGLRRTAHPTAVFLYHPASFGQGWMSIWQNGCQKVSREKCSLQLAEYILEIELATQYFFKTLKYYGVPDAFLEDYFSRPSPENWIERGNFTRGPDWVLFAPNLIKYDIVQDFDWRD